MNLLAIETSTEYLSLAACRGSETRARHELVGQRHAELILGAIGELLASLSIAARDLDAIAYGAGPGSFTGLRIACGVAQGLALARSLKVLGISTLLALAEECAEPRVLACINARMGEVYYAAYRRNGTGWEEFHAPGLCKPESLPLLEEGGWVGCGSGFVVHRSALEARLGGVLSEVRAELMPSAAAVLRLARGPLERGEGGPPATAIPLYLREKVALKSSERK